LINVCSKFFLQLHDICEKNKPHANSKQTLVRKRSPLRAESDSEPEGAPVKAKRQKKKYVDPLKEDPNAPKKPITQAYLLYYTDVRAERQRENPDLKNQDLTRVIGREWNDLTKERKMVNFNYKVQM
jgi:HMG (high mobility group) box